MKTSIIVTAYIQHRYQAHMTMTCLGNVTKFTDTKDYELILVSDSEKFPVRDDYHVLKIDKYIKTEGKSYTQAMNLGAKEATGDVLVFLQNDVFVNEGWLTDLRFYLDALNYEVVFPDQVPRSRQYIKDSYLRDFDHQDALKGGRDAGLMMITKEAFDKVGGWNEDLTLLAERDFYERMGKENIRWTDTNKVLITHIMAGTNLTRLDQKPEEYDTMMKKDADILNT